MRFLPVIDLKAGQVVRGVGGRREEYRQVETCLTADVTPAGIAAALAQQFEATEIYVADLDAIAGAEPNWNAYEAMGRSGTQLWIDAGAGTEARAVQLANFSRAEIKNIIVGLETLASRESLSRIAGKVDPNRLVFSLDLKQGKPLTGIEAWRSASHAAIVQDVVNVGISRLIVLDLSFVGENHGVGGVEICRALHQRFPHVELIGGGGVRSLRDVELLAEAGCSGVLIGSGIHRGELTPETARQIHTI